MRNERIYRGMGTYRIKITKCNLSRFINYCQKEHIELYNSEFKRDYLIVSISKYDLSKLRKMRYKFPFKIHFIERNGFLKLIYLSKLNKFVILGLVIGYIYLLFLTNFIFDVVIIHENKNMRDLIVSEMNKYDLKKYTFKKSYENIESIEENILNSNKDKIEWIEISTVGTKYIVNVETRKINEPKKPCTESNIVSKYNGTILKLFTQKGVSLQTVGSTIKKGEVIVTGEIKRDETVTGYVCATADVYGEVWVVKKIKLPLSHHIETPTENKYKAYKLEFLDKRFNLWNFSKFKYYKKEVKTLLYSPLFPFRIIEETQNEVILDEETYTLGEALMEASQLGHEQILRKLGDDEKILDEKILNVSYDNNVIELEIYYSLYRNMGERQDIVKGEK